MPEWETVEQAVWCCPHPWRQQCSAARVAPAHSLVNGMLLRPGSAACRRSLAPVGCWVKLLQGRRVAAGFSRHQQYQSVPDGRAYRKVNDIIVVHLHVQVLRLGLKGCTWLQQATAMSKHA